MGRTIWHVTIAATLLVLLAVLATLQYRWLGDVSSAERERLLGSLRARAAEFSSDFDREIARVYVSFQADSDVFDRDPAGALSDAYAHAVSESLAGIRAVFFLEGQGVRAGILQRLDPTARTLTPSEWPVELDHWKRRVEKVNTPAPVPLSPLFMGDAIDAGAPALVVPLPMVRRIEREGRVAIVANPSGVDRAIIVWLDADRLRHDLIPSLVAKHFGAAAASDYHVAVVSRDNPSQRVYASSDRADMTPRNADVVVGVFGLSLDAFQYFAAHVAPPGAPAIDKTYFSSAARGGVPGDGGQNRHVAITIFRRMGDTDDARTLVAGDDRQSAWQLLVRGKSGPLESLVTRSRHRNLAIGLGVLGLLAASFVFVIASAQRQQRLARQQLEFVAAVSHELRTPIAVIRSAGENLADGVVGDGDQVKRYGSLIRAEGLRLSDMVERVLEFAGITSGSMLRARAEVDITQVIDEAVRGVTPAARESGVRIDLHVARGLPAVVGDADALRSAVQNVIGNAVKYSARQATVRVEADADAEHVRITVTDHGIGIDKQDLPHVFKPFYRGRRAVDAQIRGTGVGLSVVKHVADLHRGDVGIDSQAGEGTTVRLVLPLGEREQTGVSGLGDGYPA
ncbi:MAG TPA: HAMP domain-containing sensor histidine kinase [Vicinamibacterales bacterium]|nr:HAMP domain-containing sensor histidine kinase [Vicinamibacterales bacterium]